MTTKIFVIYDTKTEAYHAPIFLQTTGAALRAWETTVNDKTTEFNKYPGDFTLFEIGEYDDQRGNITMFEAKKNLGTALDFIKGDQQ